MRLNYSWLRKISGTAMIPNSQPAILPLAIFPPVSQLARNLPAQDQASHPYQSDGQSLALADHPRRVAQKPAEQENRSRCPR